MNCPLDYSLCNQTVTVYRLQDGEIHRFVMENAYLAPKIQGKTQVSGEDPSMPFLLIVPGNPCLLPGDKIYQGVGPILKNEQWPAFLPVTVPGLYIAQYVKPCYWMGTVCHTEAGRN